MANKRISELSTRVPSASDLMLVGDPTTGYSYKCLVSQVGGVTSVFGRTGAVTAQEGDYSLDQLSGVTITSPASGDILTYNGSSWVNSAGGFVPYTGANQNVTLGEYGIRSGWYQFDLTPTGTPTDASTMYWDDSFKTVALVMNGTTQEIGHDQFYHVKNSTGTTIPKGTAVGFAGTDGSSGHLLITPFIANGTSPSSYFMGVTAEAITNGSFGKVQTFGRLDGIDTSAFAEGDILYVSTTTAGAFQTTVPTAPNNIIQVAAVVSDAVNGKLLVRPTLGSKLTSDESVKFTSLANGNVLQYNSTTSLWENVAPSTLAVSNIYTANGTLTGNRTVTMGGNTLTFSGGSILHDAPNGNLVRFNAIPQVGLNTATTDLAYDVNQSGGSGTNYIRAVLTVINNVNRLELSNRFGIFQRSGNNSQGWRISDGGVDSRLFTIENLNASNGTIGINNNAARVVTISTANNFLINTTTDAGFRLDVNGTMRVQNTFTMANISGSQLMNLTGNTFNGTLINISQVAGNTGAGIVYSGNGVLNPLSLTTVSATTLLNGNFRLIDGTVTYGHYGGSGMGAGFIFNVTSTNTNTSAVSTLWGGRITATSNAAGTTAKALELTANSTSGTAIALETITGNVLLATTSGNVGVGTTSPAYKFDVATATNTSAAIRTTFTGGAATAELSVIAKNISSADVWGVLQAVGSDETFRLRTVTNHPIAFHTNNTERGRITAGGNWLINTTTDAGYRLDVNGAIATNNFINFTANGTSGFRASSSTVSVEIYGGRDVTNGFRWGYSSTMNVVNSTRNLLTFGETFLSYTYAGGTNVGRIINFSHIINTSGGTNTITALYYDPTLTSTTGTTHRFLHGVTGDVLLGTTSGNVGIGTTSPSYKLHVSGTARVTGNAELSVDSGAYTVIGATGDTSYRLSVDGDLRVYGSVRTADPSGGTSTKWRLGSYAAATVQLDTAGYLEVELNGTAYKVGLVTLP